MVLGVTLASMAGCAFENYRPLAEPQDAPVADLGRLAQIKSFAIAFETYPGCQLEMATSAGVPGAADWKALDAKVLVKGIYNIKDRLLHAAVGGGADFVALRVEDNLGTTAWLRNVPTDDAAEAALRWRCAVDMDAVRAGMPRLKAKIVRLDPHAPGCTSLTPIVGTADDVTFAPYAVAAVGVYEGRAPERDALLHGSQSPTSVGVTLESQGGRKRLTVPASVLDQCFVAAGAPPPAAEVRALEAWATSAPSDTRPPGASLAALEAVTGIDPVSCLKEGGGPSELLDCRQPFLRLVPVEAEGPYGARPILFGADRKVASVHVVGGKLVPAEEADGAPVLVRTPKIGDYMPFGRALRDAQRRSALDPVKRRLRQEHGYRYVRPEEAGSAPAGAVTVDVDVAYHTGELEQATESQTRSGPGVKRARPNPAIVAATAAVGAAKDALRQAEIIKKLAGLTADTVKRACAPVEPALSAACAALVSDDERARAEERVQTARERLARAEAALQALPPQVELEELPVVTVAANVPRRRGEATIQLSLKSPRGDAFEAKLTTPFTAAAAEPSGTVDVEAALAQVVVAATDTLLIKWRTERVLRGDIGPALLGTRAWAAGVAVHAASERPVKLLADLFENRAEVLAQPTVLYGVKLPPDARRRCLTFVASGTDVTKEVNLELGVMVPGTGFVPIHRDLTAGSDASFEVCHLVPADYVVAISFAKGGASAERPRGVSVSMFDSTPGAVSLDDARASLRGSLSSPRKDETLGLDASRGVAP